MPEISQNSLQLDKAVTGFENRFYLNLRDNRGVLSDNVREIRKRMFAGDKTPSTLSQYHKLADMINVSYDTWRRLERLHRAESCKGVTFHTLQKLATLIKIPLSDLLEKDGVKNFYTLKSVPGVSSKSIRNKVKTIIMYFGDQGATIQLPSGEKRVKQFGSCVEFCVEDSHRFFVDIISGEDGGFFLYGDYAAGIIKVTGVSVHSRIPPELTAYHNVVSLINISCFSDYRIKIIDHPGLRVYRATSPEQVPPPEQGR